MKWISLIVATASMAALGWLVWQVASWQERRDQRRSDETTPAPTVRSTPPRE